MVLFACVAALLVIINATAFALMMLDKAMAEEKSRRIPESTLLLVALVGGSVGAIVGQQYGRHKTRKEPFRTLLFSIPAIQIAFLGWLALR
jgi:uncharacterized membrane protein YsdA (DUF1294 family)